MQNLAEFSVHGVKLRRTRNRTVMNHHEECAKERLGEVEVEKKERDWGRS